VSEKRNKIFVSYASPDKEVTEKIVHCLEANNKNIWFDQKEIVWGDNVIAEINTGLSESFMGIVVLSNNFFHRPMPQPELDSMILAMTVVRFRILPLYHDMQTPSRQKAQSQEAISDQEIKDVNKAEMNSILLELKNSTSNRRQATITKLRHYADARKIWKHDVTWKIIAYLVDSKDSVDVRDGLYVLEYIMKNSKKEYENDDSNPVIENARERFTPRLIRYIHYDYDFKISRDSFYA
jgi:hypothetical protein